MAARAKVIPDDNSSCVLVPTKKITEEADAVTSFRSLKDLSERTKQKHLKYYSFVKGF